MRSTITTLLVAIVYSTTFGNATYKEEVSKEVYKKIGKTVQDARKIPTFNFEYNSEYEPVYNAWYDPSNNTINLGEGIYDLATEFGADSINVIAAVLGHELAHFYKDHGWGYSFGMMNNGTHIADDIYEMELTSENRSAMEAEADYFGGIFCYMSGFNTLDITKDFFNLMYERLEIPEETFGYPTKHDRIAIYANTKSMLHELIPVFDAANYLTVLQEYDKAAACYDHIIAVFPSREMYNNLGVSLALQAMEMYQPGELDYTYPFTLDTETRLHYEDVEQANMGLKGGDEGPTREELLEEALEMFEKACEIDKEYAVGYINSALINDLLGETDMALAFSNKAVKLLRDQTNDHITANAYIAHGIALAHDDDENEAMEEFETAKGINELLASHCINVLQGNSQFGFSGGNKPGGRGAEISSAGDEAINDLEPSLIEIVVDGASAVVLAEQNENRPKMKILSTIEADFNAYYIKTYSYPKSEIGIVVTPANYNGQSHRGIAVGDEISKVEDEYGAPYRVVVGTNYDYYMYSETPIIFNTDKNGQVVGWALYGM